MEFIAERTYKCGSTDCAAKRAAGTRCPWCWGGFPLTERDVFVQEEYARFERQIEREEVK